MFVNAMKAHPQHRSPNALLILLLVLSSSSFGAEIYLPLHMNAAIEAKLEQVFVLSNSPTIKRPYSLNQVKRALKRLEDREPQLTAHIERYLKRYEKSIGIAHAQLGLSTSSGSNHIKPNQRGAETHATYDASFAAYWSPNNWVTLNVGGIISESSEGKKDEFLEGSYLSIGNEYIQADIGQSVHWLGPFQDSDMLQTTNASAVPSITLSNSKPITKLGVKYELFMAKMSESDLIRSENGDERLTGNPRLFGMHLSIQPFSGFSLGVNRLMQYGGADRDDSFSSVLNAFFQVKKNDNVGIAGRDFGNQLSSVTTRYTFPGEFPVSVYMEYGGEDTSYSSDFHLGNSALMLGLHLPKLTNSLDLTYEFGEWQNGWYVNSNYGDGLRQFETIMGHSGAEQRIFSDAVGASAHTLKLAWDVSASQFLVLTMRQISNKNYSAVHYETGQEIAAEYSQRFGKYTFGGNISVGNDVYNDSYSQLTGFVRW